MKDILKAGIAAFAIVKFAGTSLIVGKGPQSHWGHSSRSKHLRGRVS